jgi:hypothetical protein
MTQRRWPFAVQDDRGRTHRGHVTYTDALPPRLDAPDAGRFHVVLAAARAKLRVPARTAVCMPGAPKLRKGQAPPPPPALPRRIGELWLPPAVMAMYAGGEIATGGPRIASREIFPPHSDRPRLDRLALALVAADRADTMAPYAAIIRHELQLRPGTDAVAALDARLNPARADDRPPARAPAIVRLRRALKRLQAGFEPQLTLEQLTDDLRVLALFDDAPLDARALSRLLADVAAPPSKRRTAIVPFRQRAGRA